MIPTEFSQLIGNEPIKHYLQCMLDKRAVANSLLFSGPEGIGKSLFAQVLAAHLICLDDPSGIHRYKIQQGNHPDIHHYRPEGKLGIHSIQSLRELTEDVYTPPYEANYKICLIHEADRMLSYSANALLKTFEEPPSNVVIILLSSQPQSLLPTILSRCRKIYFQLVSDLEIEGFLRTKYQLEEDALKKYALLAHGSFSKAAQLAENKGSPNRELLLNILAQGKLKTYKNLSDVVATLVEQVEMNKKQLELTAKEDLCKVPIENLSAQHQHSLEKEIEGIIALNQTEEMYTLLHILLSWYRDMQIVLFGGESQYLMNPDYYEQLEQAVQRGCVIPLEYVQKAVEDARLSLQRSTSFQICLESLFLKLNLI